MNTRKTLGLMTLFICMCSMVFAQNSINFNGHIIDTKTGEHIPYAAIVIKSLNAGVSADETGHYNMQVNLGANEDAILVVEASCVGYQSDMVRLRLDGDNKYEVNFELDPSSFNVDEVVVTGNRYATKKRETATIVNTLSYKLFEQTNSVNPAQALNFQPGARVDFSCSNCGSSEVRINGLGGEYSQILLDGKPLFNSLGTVYGLEQFPSSMIERIEVVRGGASALYGSNAIGGTINIITREPIRSGVEFSNQSGIIGGNAWDVNTSLNASVISKDHKTGAYIYSMVRDREAYDRNDDGFSDIPMLQNTTIGGRVYRKLGQTSKLTGEYHRIHEFRRGGDNVDLEPFECLIAEQLEYNINGGSLTYDYASLSGRTNLSVFGAAQLTDRNSYFGTDYATDAYGNTEDKTLNLGAHFSHRYGLNSYLPATISAGIDYNYNLLDDQSYYDRDLIYQKTNIYGIYAQNEWNNDKWTFLVGARLDSHSGMENPVLVPRASIRFAPDNRWTFRASYASGYRAPQVYDEDLHISAVGGEPTYILVSDDLKPEYSNTFNLSADYWVISGNWQFNFLVDGFYTDLENVFSLTELDENNIQYRVNSPGAVVAGVNLELRAAMLDKLDIQAGYTYQSSKYDEPEEMYGETYEKFLRTPSSYGYLTFTYKPILPLSLSLNGVYTGKMLVEHEENECINESDPFFDMAFRAAYNFNLGGNNNLEVSASLKNIFDSFQKDVETGAGKDAGYIYGPALPRSFYFGVKYSF